MLGAGTVLMAPTAVADAGAGFAPVDSHGISITDYLFGFSYGAKLFGVAATPTTTIPAGFAGLAFGVFIACAWLVFTVYNLFLKLDWVNPLVNVAGHVSATIAGQLGETFIYSAIAATMLITVTAYGLRNQAGRAWHHVALTVVCMGVGTLIVLPVGEAAHLLRMGSDVAAQTGTTVVGAPAGSRPGAVLVDEFVRKPLQRWQYGHDLDSLGCGNAWDDLIRVGDADKIKDAAWSCPGGEKLHAHAMNPAAAVQQSILYPLFMVVVCVLVGYCLLKMGFIAVGAIIHAALIKPGLLLVGTSFGQRFLLRNIIDGFVAAMIFGGYLLTLFLSAALVGILAVSVPSSDVGMLITLLVIAFSIGGVRYAGASLRSLKDSAALAVLPSGSPGVYSAPSKAPVHARRAVLQTAHRTAELRSRRRLTKAVATKATTGALTPEVAIPAQVASAFAHEVLRTAHQHRTAHRSGSYSPSGTTWAGGAAPVQNRRAVNYSNPAVGGDKVAGARAMARRSSQRRTQNRVGAGPYAANPSARPAPLRTNYVGGARRAPFSESRPGGRSAGASSLRPPAPAGAAPGSAARGRRVARATVDPPLRRSGAVNAARRAALNFRQGRR
jgi:hypothetical protein